MHWILQENLNPERYRHDDLVAAIERAGGTATPTKETKVSFFYCPYIPLLGEGEMTNKELAEKIRDLYNKHPRFPTVEEVEKVLASKDDMKFTVVVDQTEKDRLLQETDALIRTFGVINILDALATYDEKQIPVMDARTQYDLKSRANYLYDKAMINNISISARFIP